MTANEIAKAIEKTAGGPFIKAKKVAEIVGDKNVSRVKHTYLDGLQHFDGRYFVPEVAERIKGRMTI